MTKHPEHASKKTRRYWQMVWVLILALVAGCIVFALVLSAKVQGDTPTDIADWVRNPEVDLVGRGAIKAIDFANWSLGLGEDVVGNVNQTIRDSLYGFWKVSMGVTVLLFLIFVVIYSYGLMVRATWLEKWRRYIPWFIASLILSAISFFIAVFFINIVGQLMTVIMQKFGTASNLVGINLDYKTFIGMSDPDPAAIEGIQNTLLLVRIVIVTLYAVGIVFAIRMFVLWFMTVLAPLVFPLLMFPRSRGFATVWLKEFTRWLILGPIFAFLLLIASYWSNVSSLSSTAENADSDKYYSSTTTINLAPAKDKTAPAVSSEAGGAGLNTFSSYSLFIVGILLIWMAIIIPWLLLGYTMPVVSEGAKKWFANKDTNLTNELRRFFAETSRPSSVKKVGNVLMSNLVNQPAGDKIKTVSTEHMAPNSVNPSGVNDAQNKLSMTSALKVNGFSQLSQMVDRRVAQLKTSQPSRLVDIAKFETDPRAVQSLTQEVDVLSGRLQSKEANQKLDLKTLRDKIALTNEPEVATHKDLVEAINMNSNQLVQPGLASSVRHNVYRQAHNEINKTLNTSNIANNQSISSSLNEINQLISQHETIPAVKTGQKEAVQLKIGDLAEKVEFELKQKPGKTPAETTVKTASATPTTAVVNNIYQPAVSEKSIMKEAEATKSGNGIDTSEIPVEDTSLEKEMSILKNASRLDNNDNRIEDILISSNPEVQPELLIPESGKADYRATLDYWQNYFRQAESPKNYASKNDWLQKQLSNNDQILKLLGSEVMADREKALEQIKYLMPYLILGNYSLFDIILYLKAKSAAINRTLNNEAGA